MRKHRLKKKEKEGDMKKEEKNEDEEEMKEKKFGGIFSGENTLIEYLVD